MQCEMKKLKASKMHRVETFKLICTRREGVSTESTNIMKKKNIVVSVDGKAKKDKSEIRDLYLRHINL